MSTARYAVLTVSDKGSRGEREDRSGQVIHEMVRALGAEVIAYEIVPDEEQQIREKLVEWADRLKVDVVLTTGGTGLAPRDVTPTATLSAIDYQVPGLPEAMRAESLKKTPNAMLSRMVAGVRGRTLIVNLPGSPKAVQECMEVIKHSLPHAVETLRGEIGDHARH
ncbi:MAG: MogA/MoaB family molybdenum cofactor biosynthesis protein [Chloroflexota bacterium]|jgi:molybdopterin adenylyltransferase